MQTLAGLFLALFFGFMPMFFFAYLVYWLDRYEKEPALLLGMVFIWGAIVAAGGAFMINTFLGIGVYLFTGSDTATELTTGSVLAPIVEESLKGLAVVVVFALFRREFDSILDGIVYAAIAALGFAATENAYYIFTYGYLENGLEGTIWLVIVRVFLVGWQHPFYTSFIGIGLALARLNRSLAVKILAPVGGYMAAIFTHSFHNTLSGMVQGLGGLAATTLVDWGGWLIMFLFILWALNREQRWLVAHLKEEVTMGVISTAQYHTACSAWAQSFARLSALLSGNYQVTDRFYRLTGELAYKKHQRASLGEEGGNTAIINRLRADIARLAQQARA